MFPYEFYLPLDVRFLPPSRELLLRGLVLIYLLMSIHLSPKLVPRLLVVS